MSSRQSYTFQINELATFKEKLLHYYKTESYFALLDSNEVTAVYDSYEVIAAAGCLNKTVLRSDDSLNDLQAFIKEHQDWCFGYLSYDLKNELEDLESANDEVISFKPLHFFIPETVFIFNSTTVTILTYETDLKQVECLVTLIETTLYNPSTDLNKPALIHPRLNKNQYVDKINTILEHIQRGDIYEVNYCMDFISREVHLDTVKAYLDLNEISGPPFAVYARLEDKTIISASPERYIKKLSDKIISQPIKGTARRSSDLILDEQLKASLLSDPKEQSENIMIVDLVRNDLSKIAKKASVQVEHLHELHTFKQVHQLISTISCNVDKTITINDVLRATFPIGSMTGAPKISAMNIIEEQEQFKRGLYSGAVGYISPNGDMDFNVIIRSILYDHKHKTISYAVGSAITAASIPEKEYEECLVKAAALTKVLENQGLGLNTKTA